MANTLRLFVLFALVLLSAPSRLDAQHLSMPCLDRARHETRLTDDQQLQLCMGAATDVPVACFIQATHDLLITDAQAVTLCRGAIDLRSIACFQHLHDQMRFTDAQILEMCLLSGSPGW